MSNDQKTHIIAGIYAASILTIVVYLAAGGARLGLWWLMTAAIIVAIGSGRSLWNQTTWRPEWWWRAGVAGGVVLVVAVSETIYHLLHP